MITNTASRIFGSITLVALMLLGYNFYRGYRFEHAPLDAATQRQINEKVAEVRMLMRQVYGEAPDFPLVISDTLPSRLYGLASLNPQGKIRVVLNKKRIRESLDYILDDVIPHEYAHAYMLYKGRVSHDDGHSEAWQQVCRNLGGSRCDRFVNHQDVILEKMGL